MCWESILRHFFYILAIFYLFFHPLPAFSDRYEQPDKAEEFFKKYAPSPREIDIKNLNQLPKFFPESPLQIFVFYYSGLDLLNRTHPQKKQEKILIKASDYFNRAEVAWMRFANNGSIPAEQRQSYQHVKELASLGHADVLIQMACCSDGLKQSTLIEEASHRLNLPMQAPLLQQQKLLVLKIEILKGDEIRIKNAYDAVVEHCGNHGPCMQNARLIFAQYQFSTGKTADALDTLTGCAFDDIDPAQKLDLWILQSLCLRQLGKLHEAHLALSKVINSPVASSKRLQAMCLRASIYEEEGRSNLALRQWQSVASSKGHWAKLAKNKVNHARRAHTSQ